MDCSGLLLNYSPFRRHLYAPGPSDAGGVRLFTRNGHDWTGRFPLIARAALSLKAASCLIDEAVACDNDGLPVFDRLRYRRDDRRVFLCAFDLIELNGDDLRRDPHRLRYRRRDLILGAESVVGDIFPYTSITDSLFYRMYFSRLGKAHADNTAIWRTS
jgi:ATP-dependent DNA ligase